MKESKFISALTYDDVLLRPGYSEILPSEVKLSSNFSKNIKVNIPICSAAMDTVTESPVAIVLAQSGGIGIIHKNLTPQLQAQEVEKVKKYETGIILSPFTINPRASLHSVRELTSRHKITGLPVVDDNNKIVGIITNRDMRFVKDLYQKVEDVMTPKERLITGKVGIDMEEAKELLYKHRIEKLPIVDDEGHLEGLITVRDIDQKIAFPDACKDPRGRLRVAAAIGVGESEFVRAQNLIGAEVDALVVDTAHGHSIGVIDMVKRLKESFPEIEVVAGNVATEEACKALINAGVDGIKVGIGPGSICTTRIIAGIGVPQLSAIFECYSVCKKAGIPFIADGGIKYSGDIVKALAAGASTVMIGSLFAGTDEAPGEMILYKGRSYKVYRGMGSIGAMECGSRDRYSQKHIQDSQKLVPEGIEGQVPYRGSLTSNVHQLLGGLRAGMGYVGAKDLPQLFEKAQFVKITSASLKESHPHDVIVTKEAPNYHLK